MAQRLPNVGSDDGNWGSILNGFLLVAHNADGTLQTSAVSTAGAEMTTNKDTDGTLAANSDTKYSSQKAIKTYVDTNLGTKPTAALDTDGTLTANSDTKIASQKATKTYVDFNQAPYVSPSAPSSPADGKLWWDNDDNTVVTLTASDKDEVNHIWLRDGTNGWNPKIINTGGAGDATTGVLSVVNARGRVTRAASSANEREAWIRDGTNWADSEIRSIWWGSGSSASTGREQPGHVHRYQALPGGLFNGVVVDQNIVFTINDQVNIGIWNGTTVPQSVYIGYGTSSPFEYSDVINAPHIYSVERYNNAGTWTNRYWVDNIYELRVGDSITVKGCLDTSFNEILTVSAIAQHSRVNIISYSSVGIMLEATGTAGSSAVSRKADVGVIQVPNDTWPSWVASRLIGNICQAKMWRTADPEPAWTDRTAITADLNGIIDDGSGHAITTPTGQGLNGIVTNHTYSGAYIEFEDILMRKL